MKNSLLLLLAACVMLSGCSKVGPELFKGNDESGQMHIVEGDESVIAEYLL